MPAAAAADAVWAMLQGNTPDKTATLFNTPSKLFVPVVVTRDNIKAEIFDKGIAEASTICTGRVRGRLPRAWDQLTKAPCAGPTEASA